MVKDFVSTIIGVLLTITILINGPTGGSSTDAAAVLAVQDVCTEIEFLTKVAEHYETLLKKPSTDAADLQKEAKILKLTAAKHVSTTEGAAYALLAAMTEARLTDTLTAAKVSLETLLSSNAEMNRRRGQIEGLRATWHGTAATYSDTKKENKGSNLFTSESLRCIVGVQFSHKEQPDCPHIETPTAAMAPVANDVQTTKNYKGIPDNAFFGPKHKNDIISKGSTDTSITNYGRKNVCSDSADSAATNGIGLYKVELEEPALTTSSSPIREDAACTKFLNSESKDKAINIKRTAAAIYRAQEATYSKQASISTLTVAQLIDDPLAQKMAMLALHGTAAEKNNERRQLAVTQLLGSAKTSIKTRFFELLQKEDLKLKLGEEETTTSIEAAASNEHYGAALAFFSAEALKRSTAAAKQIPQDDDKEKECKGETDEGKCRKKDGCEYKDGECKIKVTTTAGGTDGKTNTTGSNSFVIDRAPILITVLLF
uniref:Variant surface glycoprotein n=1 Tax=Trypanosoma brucei TaxID=5691 RepID=A0A1V0FYQ3_9TRYP|nr:variant surface glycoprotein [Trypanosoma brucei]